MIEAVISFSSAVKAEKTTISSVVIRLRFGDIGRAVSFNAFIELSISRINMNILRVFIKERKRYYINKMLKK
jgi:hypothetical protein